jgi:hypothetical protein
MEIDRRNKGAVLDGHQIKRRLDAGIVQLSQQMGLECLQGELVNCIAELTSHHASRGTGLRLAQ